MPALLNPYVSFGAGGNTFHVATTGNNSNSGTAAAPWATLAFGVTQLFAGDRLVVGGGTYYETDIAIAADGTATRPITIMAAEGETPIIDGSLAAFRTPGNSAWELFDAGRHIWRSVATFPSPGAFGYTGRIDVGGTLYALTAYKGVGVSGALGLDFLSADSNLYSAGLFYMGPGVAQDTAGDNRLYIRLDPNTSEAQWGIEAPFVISDLDPRNHAIYLAPNNNGIDLQGDYLVIDGIGVRHHWATFVGGGASPTIKNLTLFPGRFGARVGSNGWTFDNVTIQYHRPSWISRSDVKAAGQPAKDSRTGGVDWESSHDGRFLNGSIHGAFDGMLALDDNTGIRVIGNVFDGCMDDGFQTGAGVHDFEFSYNTVLGAGPSHDSTGTADTPDTFYVHHNVFDNTTRIFWARKPVPGVDPSENGTEGYHPAPIFSTHGVPEFRNPWKIYNNTFHAGISPGQQGINHYLPFYGGPGGQGVHEAYNNIINYTYTDNYAYRWANANLGIAIYDYNIYARAATATPFAIESVATDGDSFATLGTFADWRLEMGGATGYYPAGWDSHSISQTTMVSLDGSYRPAIGGPADGTGVNLSAKGWPGTTPGTTYIGAKAPV